jgi:IS30 family transposase
MEGGGFLQRDRTRPLQGPERRQVRAQEDRWFRASRRRRSVRALTLSEREEISRAIAAKESARAVALRLSRAPSTIAREIERNVGRSNYRAAKAEEEAWRRALGPRGCLLAKREQLRDVVSRKLAARWSPQQISGWLLRRYPNAVSMRVSHETIYKTLFVQAKGVLKKELMAHLRSARMMRQRRGASTVEQRVGSIKDAVSIRQRPAEAEDRAVGGHWEGDLLEGSRGTYVATLVEEALSVRDAVSGERQGDAGGGGGSERGGTASARRDDAYAEVG